MLTAINNLELDKFQEMVKAYEKYCASTSVWELSDEELAVIPREMFMSLMHREIEWVWNRLPTEYQEDREFQGYRRCTEHYNSVEFDGPTPMRKDCVMCMREEAIAHNRELKLHKSAGSA